MSVLVAFFAERLRQRWPLDPDRLALRHRAALGGAAQEARRLQPLKCGFGLLTARLTWHALTTAL